MKYLKISVLITENNLGNNENYFSNILQNLISLYYVCIVCIEDLDIVVAGAGWAVSTRYI